MSVYLSTIAVTLILAGNTRLRKLRGFAVHFVFLNKNVCGISTSIWIVNFVLAA